MNRILLISLFSLGLAFSQPSPIPDPCQTDYKSQLSRIRTDANKEIAIRNVVNIGRSTSCFAQTAANILKSEGGSNLVTRQFFNALFRAFEKVRTDKQTGASAGTAGTSIISRGVAAKTIGIAAESGALTESVKGQVVTVSGNLAGVPSVLASQGIIPFCDERFSGGQDCIKSNTLRFLRKLSFAVSFDTSQNAQTVTGTPAGPTGGSGPAPTPVNFSVNRHEISSVTGRYEIWNRRDITSKDFQAAWEKAVDKDPDFNAAGTAVVGQIEKSIGSILASTPYKTWRTSATTALQAAENDTDDQLLTLWTGLLKQLVDGLKTDPSFEESMRQLMSTIQAYDEAEDAFIDSIADKPVITFEYVDNRPVGQTPVSTFRLIGELGWGKNMLTFNGAVGVYDNAQPVIAGQPSSRVRDIEGGVQFERKLGTLAILGAAALDFSAYYQNTRSASVLTVDPKQPLPGIMFTGLPSTATQVFTTPGNIGVGQMRLVLGPGGSSVRVPIAVSWSNRTDLINKPGWRAQIGISYDFDSMFSK